MIEPAPHPIPTANLRTKILDFGGFCSSRILMLRDDIFMSTGGFPGNVEMLSQQILVGHRVIEPAPHLRAALDAPVPEYGFDENIY